MFKDGLKVGTLGPDRLYLYPEKGPGALPKNFLNAEICKF